MHFSTNLSQRQTMMHFSTSLTNCHLWCIMHVSVSIQQRRIMMHLSANLGTGKVWCIYTRISATTKYCAFQHECAHRRIIMHRSTKLSKDELRCIYAQIAATSSYEAFKHASAYRQFMMHFSANLSNGKVWFSTADLSKYNLRCMQARVLWQPRIMIQWSTNLSKGNLCCTEARVHTQTNHDALCKIMLHLVTSMHTDVLSCIEAGTPALETLDAF